MRSNGRRSLRHPSGWWLDIARSAIFFVNWEAWHGLYGLSRCLFLQPIRMGRNDKNPPIPNGMRISNFWCARRDSNPCFDQPVFLPFQP